MATDWQRSSLSRNEGLCSCLEVAFDTDGNVQIRDSRQPEGLMFVFKPSEFAEFADQICSNKGFGFTGVIQLTPQGRRSYALWRIGVPQLGLLFSQDEIDAFRGGVLLGEFTRYTSPRVSVLA